MRLTSFSIAFVLMASFFAGQSSAQIPERILFQPGSFAYGPQHAGNVRVAPADLLPVAVFESDEESEDAVQEESGKVDRVVKLDDTAKTEWETTFGAESDNEGDVVEGVEFEFVEAWGEAEIPVQPKTETIPYLAYHRNPWTHRIHVVPYEPGYAAEPEAFPKHQSKFNLLISTLPCREDKRQQVQYASYYDPDLVIIEDKPSRLQLVLGYPNGAWTTCCKNRWGDRMAQCPGVEEVPTGPYAEIGVKDQPIIPVQPGLFGGLFAAPRQIDYAAPPRRGFHGLRPAYPTLPPIYSDQYQYQHQFTEHQAHQAYQASNSMAIQQPIPYPPYTAQSNFRSRFGVAATSCQCSECVRLNEKEKIEPICTCSDREKICDSCKHSQSCKSSCKASCPSCESTDCDSCGTARTIHCPLKKAYVKKATATYSTKVAVGKTKASCGTKIENETEKKEAEKEDETKKEK